MRKKLTDEWVCKICGCTETNCTTCIEKTGKPCYWEEENLCSACVPDTSNKLILDCCCGSRMFWFNKNNPAVVYADCRELETNLCDGRRLEIKPDLILDFRNMPFASNSFKLVVFDPPHLKTIGNSAWMAQKYGKLSQTWENDIKKGFDECVRVLQPHGTLIFKWNETQIATSKILKVINAEPLFGHPSGKHGRTQWISFMKGVSNTNKQA